MISNKEQVRADEIEELKKQREDVYARMNEFCRLRKPIWEHMHNVLSIESDEYDEAYRFMKLWVHSFEDLLCESSDLYQRITGRDERTGEKIYGR